MRFATRTFLCSFLPFAGLLMGSFWAVQSVVVSTVRHGIRSSLREHHVSVAQMRLKREIQNNRSLRVVGENAALKAGLQLLLANPTSTDARLTVEDQLREICAAVNFDFLFVSSLDGPVLAGVMRKGEQWFPVEPAGIKPARRGFIVNHDVVYQITSVPVDQNEDNLAILSVGEQFNVSDYNTPAVLTRGGSVLKSSLSGVPAAEVERALRACKDQAECELRVRDQTYLSLAMKSDQFGDGFSLHSLQNLDSAVAPVQSVLGKVFLIAGIGALALALLVSAVSSRSIVRPIARAVAHLRASEKTGVLPEFDNSHGSVQEIRELTESFNRAAATIREGRESLHCAYVEFVGSLASALDARDCYTAGHSGRVSEFSCAIAGAMSLGQEEFEEIRIGALLHDIGKIGVPDAILQKTDRLTSEEFALIKEHPVIGRRILEGVHGFARYLPIVELHHENWDGSGYPRGLHGEQTPLTARIVHLADAYDAMTSDRPYRKGMSPEIALRVLQTNAGTQFDLAIVEVFTKLAASGHRQLARTAPAAQDQSLMGLAMAVRGNGVVVELAGMERNKS